MRSVRLQRVSTSWALITSKDVNCKTFLADVFQRLAILMVKKLFLVSDWNVCFSLSAVSHVFPSCNMRLALFSGWPPCRYWKAAFRFHWTLFSNIKQGPCPYPLFKGQVLQPLHHLNGSLQNLLHVTNILVVLGVQNRMQYSRCLIRSAKERGLIVFAWYYWLRFC